MPVNPETIRSLLSETKGGVRFQVYVKPESNKVALVLEEDELVFYTDELPIEGRANASLLRFLAKALGITRSNIEIVHGIRSRVKVIEVRGLDIDTVANRLADAAEPW